MPLRFVSPLLIERLTSRASRLVAARILVCRLRLTNSPSAAVTSHLCLFLLSQGVFQHIQVIGPYTIQISGRRRDMESFKLQRPLPNPVEV